MPNALLDALYRYGEPAAGLLSGMVAEPVAGWAGLLSGDAGAVQRTRDALTYQPRTAQGQQGMNALAGLLSDAGHAVMQTPIGDAVNGYNKLSDLAGAYSPALGAAIKTAPAAVGLLAGPGSGVVRDAFGNVAADAMANAGRTGMRGPLAFQDGMIRTSLGRIPETSGEIDAFADQLRSKGQALGYNVETGASNVSGSRYVTFKNPEGADFQVRLSNHGDRYPGQLSGIGERFSVDPDSGNTFEMARQWLKQNGVNLDKRLPKSAQPVSQTASEVQYLPDLVDGKWVSRPVRFVPVNGKMQAIPLDATEALRYQPEPVRNDVRQKMTPQALQALQQYGSPDDAPLSAILSLLAGRTQP